MSSQKPRCLAAIFGIRPKAQTVFPYKTYPNFFSNAGTSFFHLLRRMTGENAVFPHVALRDLVAIAGINKTDYYKYYDQIDKKQMDFFLVDAKTLKPMLVIELDHSSHQRADHIECDQSVEKVLVISRIPLVQVPVRQTYDPNELSAMFKKALHKQTSQVRIEAFCPRKLRELLSQSVILT